MGLLWPLNCDFEFGGGAVWEREDWFARLGNWGLRQIQERPAEP
jgi:hypothetical protein